MRFAHASASAFGAKINSVGSGSHACRVWGCVLLRVHVHVRSLDGGGAEAPSPTCMPAVSVVVVVAAVHPVAVLRNRFGKEPVVLIEIGIFVMFNNY